jgi:hypothetical protein
MTEKSPPEFCPEGLLFCHSWLYSEIRIPHSEFRNPLAASSIVSYFSISALNYSSFPPLNSTA